MGAPEDFLQGDWRNFTFHMATSEDFPRIARHVRDSFLRFEPMNIMLGWCEQNAIDHDGIVEIALKHGLSFYLTEKDKNEIIACNLMLDSRLEDFSSLEFKSPTAQKILGFIDKLDEESKEEFNKQFPCDFHAEVFITTVCPEFGGKGIATEMYRRALQYLKAKGFPVLKIGFSAPGTQAIGRKLGFVEYGRSYFKDYVDENGMKCFPTAKDDQFMVETAKYL